MALEGAEARAAGHVPQPQDLVTTPHREGESAVGEPLARGQAESRMESEASMDAVSAEVVGKKHRFQECVS